MLVVSVEAIYEIDRDGRDSDAHPSLAAARRVTGATVRAAGTGSTPRSRGSGSRQAA